MKKKPIKTRDYLMKRLIEGATKSGVHKDHKKEDNKKAAREKVEVRKCLQCDFPIYDEDKEFCSDSCFEYYILQGEE